MLIYTRFYYNISKCFGSQITCIQFDTSSIYFVVSSTYSPDLLLCHYIVLAFLQWKRPNLIYVCENSVNLLFEVFYFIDRML